MTKLIDYWIPQIQEVAEFQQIANAEQPEIDTLSKDVVNLPSEVIIETASDKALSKYETILGLIKSKDSEIRRTNILMKLNSRVPFTYRWLISFLNATLGQDKYQITLYHEDYHLIINVADDKSHLIDALQKDLRAKIPANIILTITTLNSIPSDNYAGFSIRIADIITI